MQFCQFGGFLGQKSLFRIFFENLKISEFFFFVFWKRIKLSAVCKKNHRNRTNGSGDNALRSKKIVEILQLFKKKIFRFVVKSRLDLKKWKTTLEKMKFFIPKQKNSSVFFFDRLFSLATLFHENWQYCKMEKKKFDFPETQGKYPLWYIKLFVYYHWSQITHKKENYGPFVSSGVEKGLENSKVEKFLRFFLFRSTISIEPFVRFWWSFLQTADNLILLSD